MITFAAFPAMAATPSTTQLSATINSAQFNVSRDQLPAAARQRMDKLLQEAATGTLTDSMKVGDSIEAGEVGGTKLYEKLVSASTNAVSISSSAASASSGNTSTSSTFIFQYYNWLGQLTNAFQVSLTCSWYKNGSSSYIENLSGTYTVLDSSFSCAWDTAYGSHLTDIYAALYMYADHNGSSTWYTFDAVCNTLASPPYISFAHNP